MDEQQTEGVLDGFRLGFPECASGQEAAAFARLKKTIAAAVPEFQL
jgi:hypothetical protein